MADDIVHGINEHIDTQIGENEQTILLALARESAQSLQPVIPRLIRVVDPVSEHRARQILDIIYENEPELIKSKIDDLGQLPTRGPSRESESLASGQNNRELSIRPNRENIPELINILECEDGPELRQKKAHNRLKGIGRNHPREVIEHLIPVIESGKNKGDYYAALTIKLLTENVQDDVSVLIKSEDTLELMVSSLEELESLLDSVSKQDVRHLILAIIYHISEFSADSLDNILPSLICRMSSADQRSNKTIARIISEVVKSAPQQAEKAVPQLTACIEDEKKDQQDDLRPITGALADIAEERPMAVINAVPHLIHLLDAERVSTRRNATRALTAIADVDCVFDGAYNQSKLKTGIQSGEYSAEIEVILTEYLINARSVATLSCDCS